MKITARDLKQHEIVDEVLDEPLGGAHNEPETAIESVGAALERVLPDLQNTDPASLVKRRYERYRRVGDYAMRNGTV
jgi:acetyl-CoA carboxylase carboxyl transferase subunit alpha